MKLALFILTLPLFANTYTTNFPLTENPKHHHKPLKRS